MIKIKKDIRLAKYSNYKIGGPARYFTEVKNEKELKEAVLWADTNSQPIFILGGGTNLLISDRGFSGLVIRPIIKFISREGPKIRVGAGVLVKDFLIFCEKNNLSGFEWAGGLPGTIGGAIRGNAGAFKGETKDAVLSVKSFDIKTLKTKTRSRKLCRFGYRSSVFKELKGREVVLEATFNLKRGSKSAIRKEIMAKIAYREDRQPLNFPNIGSIFKNVKTGFVPKKKLSRFAEVIKSDPFPVVPAAYLISETGLKNFSHGGAEVSSKHPNFIINRGGATAKDVLFLIRNIKAKVYKKFKIKLEEEVQIVK